MILKQNMTAIFRSENTNNWITLVFLGLLLLIFILKKIDSEKLKGVVSSIFNKGFLSLTLEEKQPVFSVFNGVLFLFFSTTLSLVFYFLQDVFIKNPTNDFTSFLMIFLAINSYFFIKRIMEFLLTHLFAIENETKMYFFSKKNYFYALSFGFFILLIFYYYGFKNYFFLLIFLIVLALLRGFFLLVNNKNLILSELFYFILYLCAFEIAPLFILFKLMV